MPTDQEDEGSNPGYAMDFFSSVGLFHDMYGEGVFFVFLN